MYYSFSCPRVSLKVGVFIMLNSYTLMFLCLSCLLLCWAGWDYFYNQRVGHWGNEKKPLCTRDAEFSTTCAQMAHPLLVTTMDLSLTVMLKRHLQPLRAVTSCGRQTSSPLTSALGAGGSSARGVTLILVSDGEGLLDNIDLDLTYRERKGRGSGGVGGRHLLRKQGGLPLSISGGPWLPFEKSGKRP